MANEMENAADVATWRGESGIEYPFEVSELPLAINAPRSWRWNYIFCRRAKTGLWRPIFIGEGGAEDIALDAHPRGSCIRSKGATHVHLYRNDEDLDREAACTDLIAWHSEVSFPDGCNVDESVRDSIDRRLNRYGRVPEPGKGRSTGVGNVSPRAREVEPSADSDQHD